MLNVILLLYYLTQRLQVSGKPLLLVSYVCLFLTVFVTMVGCYQLSSVCPSVHLSICLYVCHVLVLCRNGLTYRRTFFTIL